MKKGQWLTGKEIIDKWSIKPFELLNWVRKGLVPYSPATMKAYLIDPDCEEGMTSCHEWLLWEGRRGMYPVKFDPNLHRYIPAWKSLFPYISDCIFKQEQVEQFEKRHPELLKEKITTAEEPVSSKEKKTHPSRYAFIQLGNFDPGKTNYDFSFNGERMILKGLGADYLYYLIRHCKYPEQIDTVELYRRIRTRDGGQPKPNIAGLLDKRETEQRKIDTGEDFDDLIDEKTVAELLEKIDDLKKEEEEAEDNNDFGRKESIQKEREKLEDYLSNATFKGRRKAFPDQNHKNTDNVRKAIQNTLSEIRKNNEAAYNHLVTAFKPLTSNPKSYKPAEDIPWQF